MHMLDLNVLACSYWLLQTCSGLNFISFLVLLEVVEVLEVNYHGESA